MITADKVLSEAQLNRLIKRLRSESDKSLKAIQDSTRRHPNEVRTIMDYYLFSLLANTGLRISEALNLKWTDIHEDFLIIREEISKNRRRGTVYFGSKTQILLNEFKVIRYGILKRVETDFLFSLNAKVPSRSYAHIRFKHWLQQVSLPDCLSVHSLRHTYATICLDRGLSLAFVRDNLRHSNISITSQYLHLTKENRDKIKDLF